MLTVDTDLPDAEIVAAWIAWVERSAGGYDDDDWAEQVLLEIVCEDPDRALKIAFLVAQSSGDSWVLGNLGAGPIESLLAADPTILDAISLEVQHSPNLRAALASVWQNAMPEATWRAVQLLAAG